MKKTELDKRYLDIKKLPPEKRKIVLLYIEALLAGVSKE